MRADGIHEVLIRDRRTVASILAGVLASLLSAGASPNSQGNPYQAISERNVFGLRPPPVTRAEKPAPLPTITLTGITTILGDKRALLKVQFPAQPRQPTQAKSYILSEGQRDGPIEVLRINEQADIVEVNNSGTVMEVKFEKENSKPPPVAPPPIPSLPRRQIRPVSR